MGISGGNSSVHSLQGQALYLDSASVSRDILSLGLGNWYESGSNLRPKPVIFATEADSDS